MNLDCNTPEGRKWISKQHHAAKVFANHFGLEYVTTNDQTDAPIDALFVRMGELRAIGAVNARSTITLETLTRWRSFRVTFETIVKMMQAAVKLHVPYVHIVELADGQIVFWRVCDDRGLLAVSFTVEAMDSRYSCNTSQTIIRNLAHISLARMEKIEFQEQDTESLF